MGFNRRRFLQAAGLFTTAGLLPIEHFGAFKNVKRNHWSVDTEMATDLRRAGYSLIPAPQQCSLIGNDILVDNSWSVSSVSKTSKKAVQRLREGAKELFGLTLAANGNKNIILDLNAGNIKKAEIKKDIEDQAYHIKISSGSVRISANAEAGLFYGVQSFLQLLRPSKGSFSLPQGEIIDWPDLELRIIHWDTKHHQDRLETLKRYLDWAAFFKVNAIAFEIYDKYEFPRHPVIGAPGAFTKKEMQELTAYAHDRYIQLIPNVQAPAHMAYVLKHEEFAHLRADGNNYQACMCDEEAMKLIFDIYQDMIDATPGVPYFLVSTDEVYYAGICDKCKKEYNEENRSQAWVDYVVRVNEWMEKKGRRVIAWVEYPLLSKHIEQLPANLIDGALGDNTSEPHSNKEWVEKENKAGLHQLAYISMQGSEELFPNYFGTVQGDNQNDAPAKGRLKEAAIAIPNILSNGPRLKGTFAAAWDDNGLHNETFWLGWITVMQYGWSIDKPSIEQSIADFMDVYYGYDSPDMLETYQLLDEGGRFFEEMWDKVPSTEVKKGYGNSYGKGIGGNRTDRRLDTPSLPTAKDIDIKTGFREKNSKRIERAGQLLRSNEKLINLLIRNIGKVKRNKYNLEVFLSIATLQRYALNTMLGLARIEDLNLVAGKSVNDPEKVYANWMKAYDVAEQLLKEEQNFWPSLVSVWEKSQEKRNRSVNGRDFVYVIPDVNGGGDVDRILTLEYMVAPFHRVGLKKWKDEFKAVIYEYAKTNNITVRELG